MSERLLSVENLQTHLLLSEGTARVVDNVSFALSKGETMALVGESGCGKTMTAYSILRLVPSPPGKIVGGKIFFEKEELLALPEKKMRRIRGNRISMIFQEPLTSLNPVFKVGAQIAEVFSVHQKLSRKDALERSVGLLKSVGIPSPERRIRDYPHQMSGGMRQRVMIAMAIACHPRLVIADEPTTALDVTVQAQIMELLQDLKREQGMSMLLITHDLGVVAETAQSVAVMYSGRIMETADVGTIFARPLNPYTQGLLASLPLPGRNRLQPIRGMVPTALQMPGGCRFSTRCDRVMEKCRESEPDLINMPGEGGAEHRVRCWLYQ